MSKKTEKTEAEVTPIDPRIVEINKKWKRFRRVQTEVAEMKAALAEKEKGLETAIIDAENAEREGLGGNDYFRKKYDHTLNSIHRHREKMDELAESHKSEKEKLKAARARLETINKEQSEEELPLMKALAGKGTTNEAWRDTPIEHLTKVSKDALPDSIVKKLIDAKIDTVGKLADHKNKGKWLTDIPGIGEAAVTKIDDAEVQFYDDWSKLLASKSEDEEAESEEAPVKE